MSVFSGDMAEACSNDFGAQINVKAELAGWRR